MHVNVEVPPIILSPPPGSSMRQLPLFTLHVLDYRLIMELQLKLKIIKRCTLGNRQNIDFLIFAGGANISLNTKILPRENTYILTSFFKVF